MNNEKQYQIEFVTTYIHKDDKNVLAILILIKLNVANECIFIGTA